MGEVGTNTNLILVTNIAPQATRDQMNQLFGFVGRVEELKLYPSVRDASINVDSRCCFIRFAAGLAGARFHSHSRYAGNCTILCP